jgi:hypothetical protein
VSALYDALTTEEAFLVETLEAVQRVPDPVLPLKPGQMRWLSVRQLACLSAAARHELREHVLVLGLGAHFTKQTHRWVEVVAWARAGPRAVSNPVIVGRSVCVAGPAECLGHGLIADADTQGDRAG